MFGWEKRILKSLVTRAPTDPAALLSTHLFPAGTSSPLEARPHPLAQDAGCRPQELLLSSHPEVVLARSFPVTLYTALSCHGHGSNAAPDSRKGSSKGSPPDSWVGELHIISSMVTETLM